MNTKKKLSLPLLALLGMFASCNQDETVGIETPQLPNEPISYVVTEEEAINIATEAVRGLKPAATRSADLHVASIERLPRGTRAEGDSIRPGFYAVNFEEGGFALVANDERATDIYAVSDEGRFDPNANEGVELFMTMAEDYMEQEISTASDRELIIPPFIQMPDDPNDPRLWIIVDYNGIPCHQVEETIYSDTIFPLLETQWGQELPYNLECPTNSGGEYAHAGCVAVALAQVMAYHQHPASFNGHTYHWGDMPEATNELHYWENEYSLAYLMSDIGQEVDTDYGFGKYETSPASIYNCPSALTSFGYTYDNIQSFSSSPVISSIRNYKPVYMRGARAGEENGHAWVADGVFSITYKTTYYKASDLSIYHSDTGTADYFHYNWGLDGGGNLTNPYCNSDGYFLSGVFYIVNGVNNTGDYNNNVKTITNITPN